MSIPSRVHAVVITFVQLRNFLLTTSCRGAIVFSSTVRSVDNCPGTDRNLNLASLHETNPLLSRRPHRPRPRPRPFHPHPHPPLIMTLPLFRASRISVDNLDTVIPDCGLEGVNGYIYAGETFIERGNGMLLLRLDGRIEYYYPETPEVLALMEEMLFNWYLENR